MNLSLEAYSKFALEKLTAIERVNLRSTHSLNLPDLLQGTNVKVDSIRNQNSFAL